jgi:hypothetical protein
MLIFIACYISGQQEEELMAGASGSRSSRKTKTLQDLFRPPIDITYKGNLANVNICSFIKFKRVYLADW